MTARPKPTTTEILLQGILEELQYMNAERRAQQKYRTEQFDLHTIELYGTRYSEKSDIND